MFACCAASPDADSTAVDSFFPLRPEYRDEAPLTRFKPRPGRTLSARRWHSSFSEEGYLDIARVIRRIQRGGVHPSIKGAVWEFLLGCYDPNSTFDERNTLRQHRRENYAKLKAECQTKDSSVGSGGVLTAPVITEDGKPVQDASSNWEAANNQEGESNGLGHQNDDVETDKNVIQWKLTLHQIGLDVLRTDRTLVYYENQNNLSRLWDILAIYSWIDRDIGYCQGMSDLCSPISILLENEADAFWCFEHLMRRVRENFKVTVGSIGVRSQLSTLSSIMNTVDPKLHHHLEELDGGEYLFAFRMLMVLFRREFSFVDTMYLWELMWAMEYNPKLFSSYENERAMPETADDKLLKQCGKFERKNMTSGSNNHAITFPVFIVASVLESRNKRLLNEAKGLDDVVKILNDITGNMDAKKACDDALKVHTKYLVKTKTPQ